MAELQTEIVEMKHCTPAVADAVNRLLEQLCGTPGTATVAGLQAIADSPSTRLFLLQAEGRIIGMCTLAQYASPTGRKAWIEDVVVDSAMRGHGLGRLLVKHAADAAMAVDGCKLMLTSRPSRVAANRMYASMGFEKRETNVYMMSPRGMER